MKIISIALLIIGECLCIYSEMIAAYTVKEGGDFATAFRNNALIYALSGLFMIGGYMYAYRSFKNIWVVTVLSVTTILILEPLLAYSIFREAPTNGAKIGLVLGAAGMVAALF